jgi:uncharacterized repeat protein (TIGR03803 family)
MRNRLSRTILDLALLMIVCGVCSISQAQTFKYRHVNSLTGPDYPSRVTSLIIDPAGNLYGTSFYGGADNVGTVFKIAPKGPLTVLHSFSATYGGESPQSIARDSKGDLYGATPYLRGEFDISGTIFKMAAEPGGKYKFGTLWNDISIGPLAVTVDSKKNIYGIIQQYTGMVSGDCGSCLFQISAAGAWSDLWDFDYSNYDPLGTLVIDASGDVYGTIGGDGGSTSWGYVYEWSPTAGYSVLHTFSGSDGSYPDALALDAAGNLYGTASEGGTNSLGTAFKISTAGDFSTLYNFCSLANCADGYEPDGTIAVDSSGNLYGTSTAGVYEVTPGGAESVIYGPTTVAPLLVIDKGGDLYGIDSYGVYELVLVK